MTIDMGPARISGPIRGARLRVLWKDGILYTVDGNGQVNTYDVPEEPTHRNSGFIYHMNGAKGSFYKSGCSCNYPQGSINKASILS